MIRVDSKGIVMRPGHLREATAKARHTFRTRLSTGEKSCRKRMATLAVVHVSGLAMPALPGWVRGLVRMAEWCGVRSVRGRLGSGRVGVVGARPGRLVSGLEWTGRGERAGGTVLGAAAGDQRLHAEVPDETAILVVVVAAVSGNHIRAAPGSAALAPALAGNLIRAGHAAYRYSWRMPEGCQYPDQAAELGVSCGW